MEDHNLIFLFKGKAISTHLKIYNGCGKKTLLAMHGICSNAKDAFESLSQHLGSDYKIVAPDWIGFGNSTRLLDKQDRYGADYCADWYNQFLENATNTGILPEKFSLFSISMSGIPAAQTYQKHQERYDKIAFLNPAGLDEKIKKSYAFVLSSGILNRKTVSLMANDFVWRKILKLPPSKQRKMGGFLKDNGKELEVLTRYAQSGFTSFGNMRSTHILPDKFAEITCPKLLIYSGSDELFYEQAYLNFAEKYGWEISELEGERHSVVRKNPEGVAKALNDFLD